MVREEDNIEVAKRSLRIEGQRIEAQIKKLKEDLDTIRKADDILSGKSPQSTLFPDNKGVGNIAVFKGITPTNAVLSILKSRPDKWWEPLDITRELKRGEFETKAKNLHSMISATLIRLLKEGKIERQQSSEKRKSLYKIKEITK